MDAHRFFVEKIRFHLKENNTLVFVGWFFDGSTKNHELAVKLDETSLPLLVKVNCGALVRQKYLGSSNEIQEEVLGIIQLPENWKEAKRLTIESARSGAKDARTCYAASTKKLCKLEEEILYYIENFRKEEQVITASGWCLASGEVKLQLCGPSGPLPSQKIEHYYRKDLRSVFPECEDATKPGFMMRAQVLDGETGPYYLEIRGAGKRVKLKLAKGQEESGLRLFAQKVTDTVRYLQRNGACAALRKIDSKLRKKEGFSYEIWRKKYEVKPEELILQRQEQKHFAYRPKFSIVIPLYKTNPKHLHELISSILAQTYPEWELCMANSSPEALSEILNEYTAKDARILCCTLEKNEGIAVNTNAALAMASGEYVILADHDDLISPNALYEFAKALNEDPSIDVLYSDEDKISMNGKKYFEPHFKPDFNIDLLCSMNYICHLFGVKRTLAEAVKVERTSAGTVDIKQVLAEAVGIEWRPAGAVDIKRTMAEGVGVLDQAYDGAQDLDFILRCVESAKKIHHIPKILYHWRCHLDSTAANPESKLYAYEAGRRAIEAHYRRLFIPARVENGQFYGMYRSIYEWEEEPLVSIIIPNKDHSDDLAKCMKSIFDKSNYRNFEFIIVENNSTEAETFAFYNKMEEEHENVHVLYYKGGFNYSAINNFGVRAAKGEYLLLLNNDTEMIGANCIRELLGYCMRDDVGIVGAKLLYEDETIQHAGVVLGFGGIAGHAFIGKARFDTGYFGRILCAQDYSAVTAACLMTKKNIYEEVGGFTEELAVAFNDVDYCLKVRKAGKLVVYNPYAELFHYESKSRGYEDTPEKVERFNGEVEKFLSRWREMVENGDPYYNPNLTLDNSDFSLRR